jgi:uncharacterized protein
MSLDDVEIAARQAAQNPALTRLAVLWLTGEPLLVGLPYMQEAVRRIRAVVPKSLPVKFVVQTNGVLLNDEWVQFFARERFTVGVSLDGPEAIHSAQRVGANGRSFYSQTLEGVEALRIANVEGGALCVITRRTLEIPPAELFDFFHARGIAWSFLLEAKIGEHTHASDSLTLADKPRVASYLGELLALWATHPRSYIKEFETLARKLHRGLDENDFQSLGCLDIVNVTPAGQAFWGNPELMSAVRGPLSHLLFDPATTDLWAARSTEPYQLFEQETYAGVERCRTECSYFASCRGGNPAHKFYDSGRFDISTHPSCELNDMVVADAMRTLLAE